MKSPFIWAWTIVGIVVLIAMVGILAGIKADFKPCDTGVVCK